MKNGLKQSVLPSGGAEPKLEVAGLNSGVKDEPSGKSWRHRVRDTAAFHSLLKTTEWTLSVGATTYVRMMH